MGDFEVCETVVETGGEKEQSREVECVVERGVSAGMSAGDGYSLVISGGVLSISAGGGSLESGISDQDRVGAGRELRGPDSSSPQCNNPKCSCDGIGVRWLTSKFECRRTATGGGLPKWQKVRCLTGM